MIRFSHSNAMWHFRDIRAGVGSPTYDEPGGRIDEGRNHLGHA